MKKDKLLAIAMTSIITTGTLIGCGIKEEKFDPERNVIPAIYGAPHVMSHSTASPDDTDVTTPTTVLENNVSEDGK